MPLRRSIEPENADVEGHAKRSPVDADPLPQPEDPDVEGHARRPFTEPDDDVEGHGIRGKA